MKINLKELKNRETLRHALEGGEKRQKRKQPKGNGSGTIALPELADGLTLASLVTAR